MHAEPVAKDAGQVRKWIDAAQCAAHSHREVAEVVDMAKASDEMKHNLSANWTLKTKNAFGTG